MKIKKVIVHKMKYFIALKMKENVNGFSQNYYFKLRRGGDASKIFSVAEGVV